MASWRTSGGRANANANAPGHGSPSPPSLTNILVIKPLASEFLNVGVVSGGGAISALGAGPKMEGSTLVRGAGGRSLCDESNGWRQRLDLWSGTQQSMMGKKRPAATTADMGGQRL